MGPGLLWPWAWMCLAGTLLVIFTGVRYWQDGRGSTEQTLKPIFPLASIPKTLGVWRLKEGEETRLPSTIAKMAGAIGEPFEGVYVDKETGVTLAVLVIYGPAEKVTGHIPEVCYPAVGYEQLELFDLKLLDPETKNSIACRSILFIKKGGSSVARDEVYYTFRQEGKWSPTVSGNWKSLRNGPPVFKIQVQRRIADRERRDVFNPCEQFLAKIIPEIERRITSAELSGSSEVPLTVPEIRKE